MTLIPIRDAYGRPAHLQLDAIALIGGAHDAHDKTGDLWATHPVGPYCKVTLHSGVAVFVTETTALNLIARLTTDT